MKKERMKFNRKVLFLSLLAFAITNLYGQQDTRADKYLRAVSDNFDLAKGYKIQVDYIREDLMQETSAEGAGTIWMRGEKYKMVVDEFIVYYNGTKLFSQNTETEEVYVSEPDPNKPGYLQAVPIRVIKSYERDFKYTYMGINSFLGKNRVEIQLYPKEVSGPYSMLKMFINPESLKLEGIQLKHKEGIQYTMILSEIIELKDLKESTFEFDPAAYPNTEIIELIQ
jgi:outer membrane lipoprotein carrier protein